MEFTFEAYKHLIKALIENGYTITGYDNYEGYEKVAILRHDIDMDIYKALEMARLEAELGVKSTYYVLISSDFYNVFSRKNTEYLRTMLSLGHSVGLHFDEKKYEAEDNIVEKIEQEVDILDLYLGGTVTSVSMHRPSQRTLESNYAIRDGKIINSYGTEFFKNFKYVSDSRRNWREDIFELIRINTFKKLHILTHPIWYGVESSSMKQVLLSFIERAKQERYETLCDNIRDLDKELILEDVL